VGVFFGCVVGVGFFSNVTASLGTAKGEPGSVDEHATHRGGGGEETRPWSMENGAFSNERRDA